MKITSFSKLAGAITVIFTLLLLFNVFKISTLNDSRVLCERNRFNSKQLAEELRQSSDELTRMARTYVSTGDPLYEKRYWEILAIRNGERPRPDPYPSTYWYVSASEGDSPSRTGTKVPLQKLMQHAGFTKQEFHLLSEAQKRSDTLVKMEMDAFAAMKRTPPNSEYAQNVLFSAEYHRSKTEIMSPIQQFISEVDQRTMLQLESMEWQLKWWIRATVLLLFLFCFGFFCSALYIRKQIVQPLVILQEQADSISQGDYSVHCELRTSNELQIFSESFNRMINEVRMASDRLEALVAERTAELRKANHSLSEEMAERQCAQEELALKHHELEELNKTLEQRVENAITELRIKDGLMIQQNRQAAMGEMINNIAHQWKQPLNNLSLIIQAMSIDLTYGHFVPEEFETKSKVCGELIAFMSQTIDDFRYFFRADKKKTSFGIHQSIERAIRLISTSLQHENIRIVIEPGEEVHAIGYQNEYSQALLNLLGNARDVLIERGIAEPTIVIRVFRVEERAVVTVSDNGGGISPEIIHQIFNPYFTTKESGQGTGIGLFMSKNIIEHRMDGSLTAENIEDGALFRIEMPMCTLTA